MSNWACGEMQLVLPTKNVNKFLEYTEKEDNPCFYRSHFELQDREDNSHGLTKLTFSIECAWSARDCLVDSNKDEGWLNLETVCSELEVRRLAASFEEHGMMLGERIIYDQENGIDYASFELPPEQAHIDFDDEEEYIEECKRTKNTDPTVTFDDLIQGVPV